MKSKIISLLVGVGMFAGASAMAQTANLYSTHVNTDLYRGHEASFDAFGFYGSRDKDGRDDAWGMGVGINYFFSKYFGVGADTYFDAFDAPYLLNGQGIFRYPIEQTGLAPYLFGGGGRQWQHSPQWQADVGVGVEYRLKPHVGAFFDAREVFPDRTRDYAVLRLGFRFGLR